MQILGAGLNESGERLAADTLKGLIGPFVAAQALAEGDIEAFKAVIRDYVDAPLHIVDPTIFAIDKILPAPYGQDPAADPRLGNTSYVLKFRVEVLYALREAVRDALGVQPAAESFKTDLASINLAADPVGDPVFTFTRLAEGLGESGERLAESTLKGLLGPIAAFQAIAAGDNQALYDVIEAYIDAPLYIADPTIFAIDDVLPPPLGGDPATDPTEMHGSIVSNFRADTLIPARDAIKPSIKLALGLTPSEIASKSKIDDGAALKLDKAETQSKAETPADGKDVAASADGDSKKSTGAKHRAPANNPVRSAFKKLRSDVKKANAAKADTKQAAN